MTELRRRMIRDMTVRGFSRHTHEAYVRAVRGLAAYYRRSPDQISAEEVQGHLEHLITVRHVSWSTCCIAASAYRFLYHVTLGHDRADFRVPVPRQPQKLPEILSREEVARLIEAPPNPKHRLLLATVYASGLRVGEVVRLKVSDVDRDRMTLRIEQSKGAKDRYVPLSSRLLAQMEAHWQQEAPRPWLFPNPHRSRPITRSTALRVYMRAKRLAGIDKRGGIHSLRHAYATHAIEAGMDVLTLQRLLGHRRVSTTMRYFHLSQARMTVLRSPLDLLQAPSS